jgi:S-DNA-T family DNA segregation ATPase FtsK/SpoIIIE
MAKKKKSTKKKSSGAKKAPVKRELSPFWRLTGGVLLVLLALFALLGGFGAGGPLPVGLFKGFAWLFGIAAYLAPVVLAYWGVYKFITEDHKLPKPKLASVVLLLVFASSWLFAAFAHESFQAQAGYVSAQGGHVGAWLGGGTLHFLSPFPASLLFLVLTILAVFFAFGIPLETVKKLGGLFQGWSMKSDSDSEGISGLKNKVAQSGFQLHAGVPVAQNGDDDSKEPEVAAAPAPRLSSLKNSVKKLDNNEEHEALTVRSDAEWQLPGMELLNKKQEKADPGNVNENAQAIKDTFGNFNINVEMEGANVGPRVTQYTMKPPTGVKLTKITALENNLALDLAAKSIRLEAPIPGKRAVGIELPNRTPAIVRISSLLGSKQWNQLKSSLGFVIGRDIAGTPVVGDLSKMPHLLVAGQTGSGKSVAINGLLTSLLYRNSPADLKLILVDPKQVELKPYDDLPHLLTPVITEPEKCISALKWAVAEMERRYKALAEVNKRNIAEYNLVKQEEGMPYIVIVIDELADLMMMAARDVEALIVRIAQKARAVGIHLVLATQRPSVDVITGLIKANVPARIAFTTASQVDSRTIIDQMGAEKLLGQGDMLFATADMPKPMRVQGAFISDDETVKVTEFIRTQQEPNYNDEIISQPVQLNGKGGVVADMGGGGDSDDDLLRDAVRCVIEGRKASTSLLQRRLRIGYGKAARMIETMEEQGIIAPADGNRPRDVLVSSVDEVFGNPEAPAVEPAE